MRTLTLSRTLDYVQIVSLDWVTIAFWIESASAFWIKSHPRIFRSRWQILDDSDILMWRLGSWEDRPLTNLIFTTPGPE